MPDWLLAIAVAAIAASGAWLTWLTNRRSGDRREMRELTRRVDTLERRDMIWRNYAQTLRDHIYARKDPPPPPWPVEMYDDGRRHDE